MKEEEEAAAELKRIEEDTKAEAERVRHEKEEADRL